MSFKQFVEFLGKDEVRKLISTIDPGILKEGSVCSSATLNSIISLTETLKNSTVTNIHVYGFLLARLYLCLNLYSTVLEKAISGGLGGGEVGKLVREARKNISSLKRDILTLIVERTVSHRVSWLSGVLKFIRQSVKEALKSHGYTVLSFQARTVSRLIVGAIEPPLYYVFEQGTRLHPLFSIPYIPASTLKGAFRSYVTMKGLKCDSLTVNEIFGYSDREGKIGAIVFADAFPVIEYGKPSLLLEPDVTTRIYRSDYGETHREHSARSIPVIYPVTARDVVFELIAGFRQGEISDECRRALVEWLSSALFEGIGAKNAVGYGQLRVEDLERA